MHPHRATWWSLIGGCCWCQTETCEVRIEDFSVNAIYLMLQYMYGVLREMPSEHSQVPQHICVNLQCIIGLPKS